MYQVTFNNQITSEPRKEKKNYNEEPNLRTLLKISKNKENYSTNHVYYTLSKKTFGILCHIIYVSLNCDGTKIHKMASEDRNKKDNLLKHYTVEAVPTESRTKNSFS